MGGIIADVGFSDLGLKRGWDAQERDEMLRAHREIRRERGVVMRDHVESIQALMDQGYSLTDIGVMFGVTRERIRQIANEHGLERAEEECTMYRIWDDAAERFVPISRDDMAEQVRLWAIEEGVATPQDQRFDELRNDRRVEQVRAIRSLAARLGRAPYLQEVMDALGHNTRGGGNPIARMWGWNYEYQGFSPYDDAACDYVTALDRAWAAAGFERPDGRGRTAQYTGGRRR